MPSLRGDAVIRPDASGEKEPEHLDACGGRFGRCAFGCPLTPSRPFAIETVRHGDGGEVLAEAPLGRVKDGESAPPMWEACDPDHMAYLRSVGITPQLPETYTRYERGTAYNLDRYTANDGEHSVKLELARLARDRSRTAKILRTNEEHRAKVVATWVRDTFPGVAMLDDVTDAHNGFLAGCYAGIVWGLALYMFGLTHDPLPEHISGRILRGAPVRDTRAPFRDAFAVFHQRGHGLLGAGNRGAWPADDNRPKARTRAIWGEMKVSPTHASTESARGEVQINRALSGDAAVRRAGLTPYEESQAQVVMARNRTRAERVQDLRELYIRQRDRGVPVLVTPETRRLRDLDALTYEHELGMHKARLATAPDKDSRAKLSAEFSDMIAARTKRLADREPIDREAYPRLLREATSEVDDRELLRQARAAARKIHDAVYRESSEGDALASRAMPARRPASPAATLWEPLV